MKYLQLIMLLFLLSSCSKESSKHILYINSYHPGYPSSDQVMEAIKSSLKDQEIKLDIYFLDSKRNNDPTEIERICEEIFGSLVENKPDLIILSDDNALKYFGEKYGSELELPFVFCGVNWDHSSYKLPEDYFTGMLEILPVKECIEMIRMDFPAIEKLGILSENTTSEIKNKSILDTLTGMMNDYRLVNSFDEWKENFLDLNRNVDLIFLPTNGAILGWDRIEAKEFILQNVKVPLFTCDDFMMEYCMIGMTKIAAEQGEWAAEKAMEILKGKEIKDIPVTANSHFECWFNPELAKIINYDMPSDYHFKLFNDKKPGNKN
jgi:ABC-type uncharacterized transport system substrate-binding protein